VPRLPIDTLLLAKRLEEAGFAPAQAQAQVQVLVELMALHETATNTDIKRLRVLSKKDLRLTETLLRKDL
jgi:uncharacterized protein Smg (DUF494 family)